MTRALAVFAATAAVRPLPAQTYRYEAENGTLSGLSVAHSTPGYSGSGYVTGFDNDNDSLTIQANVPAGLYELWVGYNASSFKGYGVKVDGERGDGAFNSTGNQFGVDRAGVFQLNAGANTLQILKGWGFYNVDYVELRPATVAPTLPIAPTLVDAQATDNTKYLMNYLTSLYGSKTLAAQQGLVGQNLTFPSSSYLAASGGLVPAIRGSDFIDYSSSRIAHGANPNGETERIVAWAKQTGGIPAMMWHWNAPAGLIDTPGHEWWRGFYSDSTTFDLQAALSSPGSTNYNLLISDIDAIGVQLKKFQDAGIPVIWRPLHEAQGNPGVGNAWFWWGKEGPEPFKELWNLMHDRLTNVDGLHNLIWVYTSSSAYEGFKDWYPGDNVVDIVGEDNYTDPTSSMSGQWLDLLDEYNGKKMISLAETGTLVNPSLLDQDGAHWSYFMPWQVVGSPYGVVTNYTPSQIQSVLGSDDVVTLNELPVTPWSLAATADGDFNHDGQVDGADFLLWQQEIGNFSNQIADPNQDGRVDDADLAIWQRTFGQSAVASAQVAVPEPANALLAAGLAAIVLVGRRRAPLPRRG